MSQLKKLLFFILIPISCLYYTSCSGTGGRLSEDTAARGMIPGVGPFDSQGNYVERWADDKSKGHKWRADRIVGAETAIASTNPVTPPQPDTSIAAITPPTPQPRPIIQTPQPRPPSTAQVSPPKPKPASVTVKPQRKAPISYIVKKGDTLWAISQRYKTTVTAIQNANGLKGTNIGIGKRLLIPRY